VRGSAWLVRCQPELSRRRGLPGLRRHWTLRRSRSIARTAGREYLLDVPGQRFLCQAVTSLRCAVLPRWYWFGQPTLPLELKNVSRMSRNSNHGLGPLLRAHRERQGLTLEALAESIKVKRSLLDDLERNDVSRWPPGIFGRALVREYAKSIGLPTDDVVRQFLELLCPGEECDPAVAGWDAPIGDATDELRLGLANVPVQTTQQIAQRLVGAVGELVFVLATGCLVALATGLPIWTSIAIVALIWLPTAAVLCGHEVLYRILHVDRWRVFSPHPRTTSMIVEPDVQAEPSNTASIL
jgi:transcriptional regulator with XRE-family HTH domain